MSSRQRNAEKRAEHEAAYEREVELRNTREAEYRDRWANLYASLEKVGVDPNDLKMWIEEIIHDA